MGGIFIRFSTILWTFVILSSSLMAANPGKVSGSVTNAKTLEPILYANVELLKNSDSTLVNVAATNSEGKYLIENVAYGKYLLRISCIGYRMEILPEFEIKPFESAIEFGTTYLFPESKSIEEVVVTGHKITGILKDDKTIYTINPKSAEVALSSLELLRQLPDVTVDFLSEEVKLAGRNRILFQVDGRKVDHNYLENLNPELVDKIEVVTNPGARYDSEVDAVINIILKKDNQFGLNGRLRIQIPTSATILSKNNASIDFFDKKVRYYVAGNYNQQAYETESTNERTTYSPNSNVLLQNSTGTNRSSKIGINYGVDWFYNENNILNFYSTIRPRTPAKSEFIADNRYTSDQIVSHNQSRNRNVEKNFFYDYSLFYQHKFTKKSHEISIESYLSNRGNSKTSDYYEQDYITEATLSDQLLNTVNQETENHGKQLILKVDYIYPLSDKLKLSAGYNGNVNTSDYSYSNETAEFMDQITYDETRHAAYSNLSLNARKLNLQTGVRYEFSDIQIDHGNLFANKYNCFLPSLAAQYKFGKKNTMRLNYRKSVIRPGLNQLSPINYKEDSYLQSTGNPDLKPSYINRFEFTHRIQISDPVYLSYMPYLSLIKNDIRQVNITISDSILLKKYSNVNKDFEYGITLSGTLPLMKVWSLSSSFTYYRRELNALPDFGIDDRQKRTSWRLNISTQYVLPKEWVLFIDYNYNAPVINYQSITHPYYEFMAGFNKAINKKINLSVFTFNPWSNQYVFDNQTITTNNMVQRKKDTMKYNYLFFIRLGYKFNSGKIGKKLDRQIETGEEQEVKKGIFN